MTAIGTFLAGTYTSLCTSFAQCIKYHNDHDHNHNHDDQDQPRLKESEKGFGIIDEQPQRVTPLVASSTTSKTTTANRRQRAPKRRKPSTHSIFSTRQRLLSNASSTTAPRRPHISAPTNFQHVYSGSFQFPEMVAVPKKAKHRSFRPLELSINLKDNRLSPMLPHFAGPSPPRTPPHRIIPQPDADSSPQGLNRSRSYSSASFHVPRRVTSGGSVFESPRSLHSQHSSTMTPTTTPPRGIRKRAYTSPESPPSIMEDLVERVAQAMLERDELQDRINDVVERQSLYTISRPSSMHEAQDMEPMPEVPALPPNAPSFSERLNIDRRPSTPLPPTPLSAHSTQRLGNASPPPPLPMRLRPPLRKKKSFSRISDWLVFQTGEPRQRQLSLDSVTNFPRPITDTDGFYEVAQPSAIFTRRSSLDSISSASDWSAEEEQTVPTSWSPGSDATIKAIAPMQSGIGSMPLQGSQKLRPSRAFVFPIVPRQTLRRQARDSTSSVPRTVGVAV